MGNNMTPPCVLSGKNDNKKVNVYTVGEANPDSLSTMQCIVLRESGLASPTVPQWINI